jgi:hypothetical protein
MSDWQQVGNATPIRTTAIAVVITPTDPNYYRDLSDYSSDADSIPPSHTSGSSIAPVDEFWDDESIFWETTRRDILNTTDLEEEILFSPSLASIKSFSLVDSGTTYPEYPDSSDSKASSDDGPTYSDTMGKTDYRDIAALMEIKSPGSTTPTTEPTTIQLLQFKKTLVSALAKCSLNASNKGHTYIIETQ